MSTRRGFDFVAAEESRLDITALDDERTVSTEDEDSYIMLEDEWAM